MSWALNKEDIYCELYCSSKLYRCLFEVTLVAAVKMDDDRCRLLWKNGEDVTKWILRVETYAAARGWNNNKMAAMVAIGLPDDKVEFLLTMSEEDRKDWSKLKTAILMEY